jgi:aminocarboxymuconate-semialdehyde decarboxylase
LRRFYFDTVTHSPHVMRFLVDFAGPEQVLLGTDYPFEMGERDPVGLVGRVPGLAEDAQRQILEDNLGRLIAEVRHVEVAR